MSDNEKFENEGKETDETTKQTQNDIKVEEEQQEEKVVQTTEEGIKTDNNELTKELNKELKQEKRKRRTIFGGIVIAAVLALSTWFLTVITDNIEHQVQDNTVLLQRQVDKVINNVNLYEATQNEDHIIQLQSDLSSMLVLLEQTSKINDSLSIDIGQKKHVTEKLYNAVKLQEFYLEESLKGKLTFVPNDVLVFRDELNVVSKYLSENPQVSYDKFVFVTNAAYESMYSDCSCH